MSGAGCVVDGIPAKIIFQWKKKLKLKIKNVWQEDLDWSRGRAGKEAGGHRGGRKGGRWSTGLCLTQSWTLSGPMPPLREPLKCPRVLATAFRKQNLLPGITGEHSLRHITSLGLLPRKSLPSFPRMPRTQIRQDLDFAVNSGAPWWQVLGRCEGHVPASMPTCVHSSVDIEVSLPKSFCSLSAFLWG